MVTVAKAQVQQTSKYKQQLYLERVNQFFVQVEHWLPQFEIIRTENRSIQDETGEYKTPCLSIVEKNVSDEVGDFMVANLLPDGTSVLMGEGLGTRKK